MKSLHVSKLAGLALCAAAAALTMLAALSPPIAAQQSDKDGKTPAAEAEKAEQAAIERKVAGRLGNDTTDIPKEMYKYVILDYVWQPPKEKETLESLDQETAFEFVDVPLSDAVEYFKDLHGIEIVLDKSLKDAGIPKDKPITRSISGISLREALRLMLADLGLDFVVRDEVLSITSREAADQWMETHVYEVRHLKHFTAKQVAEMIRETVRPGSWRPDEDSTSSSGAPAGAKEPRGAIVALDGGLIVTQSQRGHEAVIDLLHQLARFDVNPLYK